MTAAAMSSQPTEREREIAALAPWFHNLHLPDGTQTVPDHWLGDYPSYKWRTFAPLLPDDLHGVRALDIGCNAGYYAIELARRGAVVLGIDSDPHYLRQAQWAAGQFGLEQRVTLRQMQVYDLARMPEQFDLVLFMGVFYHLRYPFLGLEIVARRVRERLVFQTLTMKDDAPPLSVPDRPLSDREILSEPGWPRMAFVEHCLQGDPTNWWVPNHSAVEAMLRATGMRVVAAPGEEIYLCERDPGFRSDTAELDEAQYRAVCGLPPQA